jgi:hypothetical protein
MRVRAVRRSTYVRGGKVSRRLRSLGAIGIATAALAATAAPAGAVTIGQVSAPDIGFVADTYLQTGSSGAAYTVPFNGVITSWSFEDDASPATGLKLKVGRSVGTQYMIVGEAAAPGTQAPNAVNGPYAVNIPVQAGDVIGIYATGGDFFTTTGSAADNFYSANPPADPPPGSSAPFGIGYNRRLSLSAEVVPAPASGPTGQRAAALRMCKKKHSAKTRKKCRKKAKRLPV